MSSIIGTIKTDETKDLCGYGLVIGELTNVRLMNESDEAKAFVKWCGVQEFEDKEGNPFLMQQWVLEFKNIELLTPFEYRHGKQGVGFLPEEYTQFYVNR